MYSISGEVTDLSNTEGLRPNIVDIAVSDNGASCTVSGYGFICRDQASGTDYAISVTAPNFSCSGTGSSGTVGSTNVSVAIGCTATTAWTIPLLAGGGDAGGVAGTLAGSANGTGDAATFNAPQAITGDGAGNVYVADTGNLLIRKITAAGAVTTFSDLRSSLSGVTLDYANLTAVVMDTNGDLFIADPDANIIIEVSSAGVASVFAGSGSCGSSNATGTAASFCGPQGLVLDSSNDVYVADTTNRLIRKITPGGVVTTLASLPGTLSGAAQCESITMDSSGNLFVADYHNNLILKVTTGGVVSTFAGGGGAAVAGEKDGTGSSALFTQPSNIGIDSDDNLFVLDRGVNVSYLRKITPAGVVTTPIMASELPDDDFLQEGVFTAGGPFDVSLSDNNYIVTVTP